ncbi:hypothetical protein [Burkholderia sp. Bp8990]|uniref:hypothetical protein n=1 Tax=Burkholderia sp. Bp8990 TaxID=2184552 RepID=UPI000F5B2D9F|nr:hypothetical protein [Burkholderia sp. Bp8990]RQS39759.1 hypothetical protein DIE01_16230 [Burkholderia sp. Bp8990]
MDERSNFVVTITGETTDDKFEILAIDLIDATQFVAEYIDRRYPRAHKSLYSVLIGMKHS